ncbi:MAG: MotA/TolQ/ExbB proton channel family protein [Verrucomicrobia bacterium]|nr:MotA/TolQ/ExbB proton channel family protein [Verrucomicrobiota bacterium]
MKKHLFLKWCLATVITVAVVFLSLVLAQNQALNLNPIAKTMVGVIVLVYLIATTYCATLCWQTDQALEDLERNDAGALSDREEIKNFLRKMGHKADQVSFAANECPYIGLLGAITGIFFFMTSSLGTGFDPSHIKEVMADSLTGIGIAFIPTITGVFFRIILSWEYYMVIHEVESALKGFSTTRHRARQMPDTAVTETNAVSALSAVSAGNDGNDGNDGSDGRQANDGMLFWQKRTSGRNGPAS